MNRLSLLASLLAVSAFAQSMPALDVTQGNLEIHDAAKTGSGDKVKALLKVHPDWLDVKNIRGSTPLHLAAINPDASALRALLEAGAKVNLADDDGFTPLPMAAFHRQADYALLLLEAGADVNAKTNGGRTPLAMAEKARADETAGIIALWILKGCKPGSDCGLSVTTRDVKKLVK